MMGPTTASNDTFGRPVATVELYEVERGELTGIVIA